MSRFNPLNPKNYPPIPDEMQEILENGSLFSLSPKQLISEFEAFVIEKDDRHAKIAAIDPGRSALRRYAKQVISPNIEWYQATKKDLGSVLRRQQIDFREEIGTLLSSYFDDETTVPKLVDYIIQYAFAEGASDIHIEPKRNDASVRFRMDGILHSVLSVPLHKYPAVVTRFKILANLKTDESRRPQDGRIEPEGFSGSSLRVSTMPTLYGEKIVLRVLNESNTILEPSGLGFSPEQERIIQRNIDKPFGMIVASGPTGSGKTTTLYALLQLLKKDDINIATLEDPIEFALDKVNQTQVNPELDFSFASGLRSLLRQDPDVILVGEIRDHETISMAANASMTGHLVLTSMHTNDAASAFSRFLEMGVDDFMVASVVNLVIAQRLVRKLCPACKKNQPLDPVIVEKIRERKDLMDALEKKERGLSEKVSQLSFETAVGCERCLKTGYSGRIGIFELLEMNKPIHDLILSQAPADEIQHEAERTSGFSSMMTDGIEKVFTGHTTFNEVLRATRSS